MPVAGASGVHRYRARRGEVHPPSQEASLDFGPHRDHDDTSLRSAARDVPTVFYNGKKAGHATGPITKSRLGDHVAYIDELMGQLPDDRFRRSLEAEVARLRSNLEFGLVFERHLPELVRLPAHPIRRGVTVQKIADPDSPLCQVLIVKDDVAVLVDPSTFEESAEKLEELVVVRRFGESIHPGLTTLGRVERGGDKPFHTVINAENYHALEMLEYVYAGEIDVIYIDPPYNSGARDWKYNNDYVDGNDAYRHSKWLSFMERRLKLAKRLLNPTRSTLVVTIDEKEVHTLGMLLNQLFRGCTRQLVTIVINPLGQARKAELARVEEYAFFVFIGDMAPTPVTDDLLTENNSARAENVRWEWLLRGGTNSRRVDRPNLFYPIYVEPDQRQVVAVGDSLPLDMPRTSVSDRDDAVTVWPLRRNGDEGSWRLSPETLRDLLGQGLAKLGVRDRKTGQWSLVYLGSLMRERLERGDIEVVSKDEATGAVEVEWATAPERIAKTVWNRLSHRAGEHGTALLRKFIGPNDFPFPKSLYAVADTLRIAEGGNKDALVLDFFGGSATTFHAAALLNREDGGHRRTIIVTNNEVSVDVAAGLRERGFAPGDDEWEKHGIFRQVARPRVQNAVNGTDSQGNPLAGSYLDGTPYADGLEENVEFFELTYLDTDTVSMGGAFNAIAPLLWLKAGGDGPRVQNVSATWTVPDSGKYAVLFDAAHWSGFGEAVSRRDDIRIAYIVTDSEAVFRQATADLPVWVEPVMLYSDYLRNFELNTGDLL